jgi:hypothetical protein
MEKPIIDIRTSALGGEVGEAFTFTPQATNVTADAWKVSGLPTGLAANASTGQITGTLPAGVFIVGLVAIKYYDRAISVDVGTDIFTALGHGFSDWDTIRFSGTDLPAPLEAGVDYAVRDVDQANGKFKVAAVQGGDALNITDAGTGSQAVAAVVASDQENILISGYPVVVDSDEVQDDLAVKINFDMITGKVTIPGTDKVSWGPPGIENGIQRAALRVKQSDRFPILLGVTREDGTLQDLPLTTIRIGTKEREPENRLVLTESETDFLKVGSGKATRYRIMVHCDKARFAKVLANYESDGGTFYDALGEIAIGIVYDLIEYDQTQSQALANVSGGATLNKTFNYVDLPKPGTAKPYILDLALAFANQPGQDVTLQRTLDLTWDGNLFQVDNLAGTNTDQGAEESPHWRSTFSNLSVSGNASGVSVATRVQTSGGATELVIVVPLGFLYVSGGVLTGDPYNYNPEEFYLWHILYGSGPGGGNWDSALNYGSPISWHDGDDAASIQAKVQAVSPLAGDLTEVRLVEGSNQVVLVVKSDSQLGGVSSAWDTAPTYYRQPVQGDVHNATVLAHLYADTNAGEEQRKSSETLIFRIERDLNPD